MSDAVLALKSLVEQVRTEARTEVRRVLRQLAHDLNTPISTLTMEVFSARMLLDKLRPSTRAGEKPDSVKVLSDLGEICSNLEHASSGLTEYVSTLSRLASDSAEPEGPLPPAGEKRKSKAVP